MKWASKFVLTRPETWQVRVSQRAEHPFAQRIRKACDANEHILACFLFDARAGEAQPVNLIVAVQVKDEEKHMGSVVAQIQDALRPFPRIGESTAIMSSKSFECEYAGSEFYRRKPENR